MNPQTPPNVPYHDSAKYETEFDLNTPRPVEETQHIPVLLRPNLNTDANASIVNGDRDYTRFQQRAKKESHISNSDEETENIQCYKGNELDFESNHSKPPRTSNVSQRAGVEIIDTTITQESDTLKSEPGTSDRQRKRRSHKSKHSHFLKKRGIDSDQQEIQSHGEMQPSMETNLNLDPHYLDIQTHHVHFQPANESDFQDLYLPNIDGQKRVDEDVHDIDQHYSSKSHATADYSPPPYPLPVDESENAYVRNNAGLDIAYVTME